MLPCELTNTQKPGFTLQAKRRKEGLLPAFFLKLFHLLQVQVCATQNMVQAARHGIILNMLVIHAIPSQLYIAIHLMSPRIWKSFHMKNTYSDIKYSDIKISRSGQSVRKSCCQPRPSLQPPVFAATILQLPTCVAPSRRKPEP